MQSINSRDAEAILQEALPEKPNYWKRFLTNNRDPNRNPPYRIPFERSTDGSVRYVREDLSKFVEWEKSRRLGSVKLTGRAAEVMRAFGIGEAGSMAGRKFDFSLTEQIDPITKTPYLQLVLTNPLMVFRLEIDEAKVLRQLLDENIQRSERMNHEN